MLVLASDTTGKSLSTALVRDGHLIGENCLNLGYNHAVTHVPAMLALLETCEIKTSEIDLFACTQGPGSFTGTRIGLSTCKAMAYAAVKPAIGVSTLAVLAWPWRAWPQSVICPSLDARNGRIYAAAYCWLHAEQMIVVQPGNYTAVDFHAQLMRAIRDWPGTISDILLTGDGADTLNRIEPTKDTDCPYSGQLIRLDPLHDSPRAAIVAELAVWRLELGESGDPMVLAAEYLTPSSAERKKSAKP